MKKRPRRPTFRQIVAQERTQNPPRGGELLRVRPDPVAEGYLVDDEVRVWTLRRRATLSYRAATRQGHCVVGFPLVTAVTRSGDRRRARAMLVLPQFEVEPRIRNPQTRAIYPRNGMTRSHQPRPDRRPTDRTPSVHIDKSQTSPAITGLIRPQSQWTPDEPDT